MAKFLYKCLYYTSRHNNLEEKLWILYTDIIFNVLLKNSLFDSQLKFFVYLYLYYVLSHFELTKNNEIAYILIHLQDYLYHKHTKSNIYKAQQKMK